MSRKNIAAAVSQFASQIEYHTHKYAQTPYALLRVSDMARTKDWNACVVLAANVPSIREYMRVNGEYAPMILDEFANGTEYESNGFSYETVSFENGKTARVIAIGNLKLGAIKARKLAWAMSRKGFAKDLTTVETHRNTIVTETPAPKATVTKSPKGLKNGHTLQRELDADRAANGGHTAKTLELLAVEERVLKLKLALAQIAGLVKV